MQRDIERISDMEITMEKVEKTINALEKALDDFYAVQDSVQKLETYYTGRYWKRDRMLDEQGKLPKHLKRGVLSEDGIFNLLERNDELNAKVGESD